MAMKRMICDAVRKCNLRPSNQGVESADHRNAFLLFNVQIPLAYDCDLASWSSECEVVVVGFRVFL